ncbi:hypothetical protein ACQPXS_32745 [Streptomyces sp. CA-142005]|uniref:hypothetical protein n=1 Tax=Streptomyces sp. CA-142005 TaxID=3240052 RepID=UPI003D909A17
MAALEASVGAPIRTLGKLESWMASVTQSEQRSLSRTWSISMEFSGLHLAVANMLRAPGEKRFSPQENIVHP